MRFTIQDFVRSKIEMPVYKRPVRRVRRKLRDVRDEVKLRVSDGKFGHVSRSTVGVKGRGSDLNT